MKKQLEDFLPYLKDYIGNIDECRRVNDESNIFYVIKDKRLSDFITAFYALDILNSDYSNYLDERDIESQEVIEEKFNELSLEDLYAVLTLYIRSDRFVEGRLVTLAEKGILYKTVKRIIELKQL